MPEPSRMFQLSHTKSGSPFVVNSYLEDVVGKIVGVEVKASASVSSSDFKGLHALQEITGERFQRGVLLYTGTERMAFGTNLLAMPVASLWRPWSEVGQPGGRSRLIAGIEVTQDDLQAIEHAASQMTAQRDRLPQETLQLSGC